VNSRRSPSGTSVQARTVSLRGGRRVPFGTMPSSIWQASRCSRSTSQPWANSASYFLIRSNGAWCGAWQAPKASQVSHGVFSLSATWSAM
jgi:hypothetical protein